MQRLFLSSAVLLCASVSAQTTINITLPGSQGSCIYTTGPVLSNSTPGQLAATASSSTGTGCGGGGGGGSSAVSFGPASPLAPTSTTVGNTGGIASFSFQAVNAAQCTGSITGTAAGIFTGGTATTTFCSNAADCGRVQSVSTTFPPNTDPNNDVTAIVVASCTGASGPPVTSQATVTVSHTTGGGGGGSCATIASTTPGITNFTQQTTNVIVDSLGGGTFTANPMTFAAVYKKTWPGTSGLIAVIHLPTNKYLSESFSVLPSNYMTAAGPYLAGLIPPATTLYGQYTISETQYSVPVSMTISTQCGDFSNPSTAPATSSVVPGCYVNKGAATHNNFIAWTNTGSCLLTGGQSYYLNIINADISNVTPSGGSAASTKTAAKCPSGTCTAGIVNGDNNWSQYTPPQ